MIHASIAYKLRQICKIRIKGVNLNRQKKFELLKTEVMLRHMIEPSSDICAHMNFVYRACITNDQNFVRGICADCT